MTTTTTKTKTVYAVNRATTEYNDEGYSHTGFTVVALFSNRKAAEACAVDNAVSIEQDWYEEDGPRPAPHVVQAYVTELPILATYEKPRPVASYPLYAGRRW